MTNTLDFSLINAVKDRNTEEVELLLKKGANVDAQINGATPLVLASGFNEFEICHLLLKYGADPNLSPDKDTTPLITAASFGHCRVVRLLAEAGGDPELKDSEGLNAHYWASKSKCQNCCSFLQELKRNEAAFKKVHFSESLGSTTDSSSSRISCMSEEQSRFQKCPSISKSTNQNCFSSPKSPLRLNLSPKDIAKLRCLLSVGNKKEVLLQRKAEHGNDSLLQSRRLSSSMGNLKKLSDSSQFSGIFLHRNVSPVRNFGSGNLIFPGLPPKSPRIQSDRCASSHLSPTPPCRYPNPVISNLPLNGATSFAANQAGRHNKEVSTSASGITKGKSFFSGIPLSASQTLDRDICSQPPTHSENIKFKKQRKSKQSKGECSLSELNLLLSIDDDVDEEDTRTLEITPPSSCAELDTAFRKSSSEPRLTSRRQSDDDMWMDRAFCEAFSGLSLTNRETVNEAKDFIKGCNKQKTLPKEFMAHSGSKDYPTNSKSHQASRTNAPHVPGDPVTDWSFEEILSDIEKLTDSDLRSKLMTFRVNPGPILKSTRRTYQLKLAKLIALKNCGAGHLSKVQNFEPSLEIVHLCSNTFERSFLDDLENEMSQPFSNPDPTAKWRQGTKKSCFNYLLLDPRITKNLPNRVKTIGQKKGFLIFVESIFYVGKGQKMRPYEHFKEASTFRSKFITKTTKQATSRKVSKILEIWRSGKGVVSLCAFQNAIPVESLTREACMIEAIGLENLTNVCKGQLYGPASNWLKREVRCLGSWLLWKSFMILLNEGERQIRHKDVNDTQLS